jgi:hypothetical protein
LDGFAVPAALAGGGGEAELVVGRVDRVPGVDGAGPWARRLSQDRAAARIEEGGLAGDELDVIAVLVQTGVVVSALCRVPGYAA